MYPGCQHCFMNFTPSSTTWGAITVLLFPLIFVCKNNISKLDTCLYVFPGYMLICFLNMP